MEGTFLEEELEKKEEVVEVVCESDSEEEEEEGADFEFAFVCRDPDTAEITADELFFNGQIRPTFPVPGCEHAGGDGGRGARASSTSGGDACDAIMLPLRKLLIEDRGAAGAAAEGEYCLWTPRSPAVPPSPGQCKKSRSTGSSSRRWRLRDLLHRSSSDGKDAFVFLSAETPAAPPPTAVEKWKGKSGNSSDGSKKKKKKAAAARPISAHEIYLRKRAVKEAHGPRYALPYRPGIMGFFSNA